MIRKRLKESARGGGLYFPESSASLRFISTGCEVLNCVLGGGWARGRIGNIVGDKSTGKTLLVIEACANFAALEPGGDIFYREIEAAFDIPYAQRLGLPKDRVDFGEPGQFTTVEDIFEDLQAICERAIVRKKNGRKTRPILYIVDSLDALSDRAEQERDVDKGSYGVNKAKKLSELFRKLVGKLARADVTVLIISQVRDNINATFGKKYKRSGGHALDFYASHVLYLAQIQRIKAVREGVERKVGVMIRCHCEKNKVANPFRECDVPLMFSYGIDDLAAACEFFKSVKKLGVLGINKKEIPKYLRRLTKLSHEDYQVERERVAGKVRRTWVKIEKRFEPTRRKYG
jgi:recombination protein RecA